MMKVTFWTIAAVLSLGASVWAAEYSDFVNTCEKAVRIRKENYKSHAYVTVPAKLTEDHLKNSLEALQRIFGDEMQMRIYDSTPRVQIFWDYSPRRSPIEFLNNSFINTLDPTIFRQFSNSLLQE